MTRDKTDPAINALCMPLTTNTPPADESAIAPAKAPHPATVDVEEIFVERRLACRRTGPDDAIADDPRRKLNDRRKKTD